jgi:hypothetical protein
MRVVKISRGMGVAEVAGREGLKVTAVRIPSWTGNKGS